MPNNVDYSTLANVLLWISVILSVVVLVEVACFIYLNIKMSKRLKAKRKLNEEKAEESKKAQDNDMPQKLMAAAPVILAPGFPVHVLLVCIVLAIECGILAFAISYLSKKLKKPLDESEPEPEPEPEHDPIPEPVVVPVGPTEEEEEFVAELVRESITIEEAHNAITDEVAVHFVEIEKIDEEKRYSKKSIINIDTLSANFEPGEIANLETMKEKGLLHKNTDFVKVLAHGMLDKHLTVEAQDFSADAVKMIILTGGHAVKKS
jgi:hypothetical protein